MATTTADRRMIKLAMSAPYLERDEEQALAQAWKNNKDQEARNRIAMAHMRLVVSMAGKFRNFGLPLGDLVQEGYIGLLEAAARFEPERQVRFSTYASWWIRASIQDYVLRNWSIVRGGTSSAQKALFFNLRRLRARIEARAGNSGRDRLTPEGRSRLARQLNVSEADVQHMEGRLGAGDRSLNMVLSEDGDSDWQDMLVDERPDPEAIVMQRRDGDLKRRWLGRALADLPERERRVLQARFFADRAVTLECLGAHMGISKERVRQLEAQALTRLRRRLGDIPDLQREYAATD